ncbi:hypothetical protein HDF12_002341 [Edaphobacter lichenicola]|uniref:Uncharacterized protein n=1 Tax=Tunturiibacter lichenicola TaxID=2051959 RepID=A0A7Y9NM99_9BACT|nr:hypothetical protein [Edaphobacter lichenicola]
MTGGSEGITQYGAAKVSTRTRQKNPHYSSRSSPTTRNPNRALPKPNLTR